jgi:hypothetical protein
MRHSGDQWGFEPCNPLGYVIEIDPLASDQSEKDNITIHDWSYKLWPRSLGSRYTGPCVIEGSKSIGTECVTTFSTGDIITADECIIVTEILPTTP